MPGNEVSSNSVTADGTVIGARARVKGIVATQSTASGTVTLRDGGASGTIRLQFDAAVGINDFDVPGDGILFSSDVYADIDANTDRLTVFYQF